MDFAALHDEYDPPQRRDVTQGIAVDRDPLASCRVLMSRCINPSLRRLRPVRQIAAFGSN
jgi:hypothetical protein